MRGDAIQTFKNITSQPRENLEEIFVSFRRKYVQTQSMATAKHKFQKLVFEPSKQNLVDFIDELESLAKASFGQAAQSIIEQFIYAKMPPHHKKTINQAHLENGTYEQFVKHLEKELELNGLEAPDGLPVNNINRQPPEETEKQKAVSYCCKKPVHLQVAISSVETRPKSRKSRRNRQRRKSNPI